jgi:hypothetical protein
MKSKPANGFLQLAVMLVILMLYGDVEAQWLKKIFLPGEHDSIYITTYPDDITIRLLSSSKDNTLNVFDAELQEGLLYKPNNRAITAVGAHYGLLGFNVGWAVPWSYANKDDHIYGKTDYLDLQFHFFFRSFVIDIYYLRYNGFYLENSYEMLNGWENPETYRIRPDIGVKSYGGSFHYFFNKKKFSYKAVFTQNEWQRKSAGSLILGGGIFFIPVSADSSFIPNDIKYDDFFRGFHFKAADMFSFGPTVGYTHTFVMWKKLFLNLTLVGGLTAGYTDLVTNSNDQEERTGFTWHFQSVFRTGFGYNSDRWYVGLNYMNAAIRNQTSVDQGWLQWGAGVFQFTVARRIHIKRVFKPLRPEYW